MSLFCGFMLLFTGAVLGQLSASRYRREMADRDARIKDLERQIADLHAKAAK